MNSKSCSTCLMILFAAGIFGCTDSYQFIPDSATPPHANHMPYVARIEVLSSAAASGTAVLSEVTSLTVTAGSHAVDESDLSTQHSGYTVSFSSDRSGISGLASR